MRSATHSALGAARAFTGYAFRPRLVRQPDQHLAQLARPGHRLRKIQPQGFRAGRKSSPPGSQPVQRQSAASAPSSRVA